MRKKGRAGLAEKYKAKSHKQFFLTTDNSITNLTKATSCKQFLPYLHVLDLCQIKPVVFELRFLVLAVISDDENKTCFSFFSLLSVFSY